MKDKQSHVLVHVYMESTNTVHTCTYAHINVPIYAELTVTMVTKQ